MQLAFFAFFAFFAFPGLAKSCIFLHNFASWCNFGKAKGKPKGEKLHFYDIFISAPKVPEAFFFKMQDEDLREFLWKLHFFFAHFFFAFSCTLFFLHVFALHFLRGQVACSPPLLAGDF